MPLQEKKSIMKDLFASRSNQLRSALIKDFQHKVSGYASYQF